MPVRVKEKFWIRGEQLVRSRWKEEACLFGALDTWEEADLKRLTLFDYPDLFRNVKITSQLSTGFVDRPNNDPTTPLTYETEEELQLPSLPIEQLSNSGIASNHSEWDYLTGHPVFAPFVFNPAPYTPRRHPGLILMDDAERP